MKIMASKTTPYIAASKSQTHLTPDRVYEMINKKWGHAKEDMYDPCPAGVPYKAPCFFNALYEVDWYPVNYVNPPFEVRTLEAFVKKAIEQLLKDRESIMLLPVKTDQDWFHEIILKKGFEILWIRRRLRFKNNTQTAGGSHFLVRIS